MSVHVKDRKFNRGSVRVEVKVVQRLVANRSRSNVVVGASVPSREPRARAYGSGGRSQGEDAHLAMTGGAAQRVHLVDARKQLGPATPGAYRQALRDKASLA